MSGTSPGEKIFFPGEQVKFRNPVQGPHNKLYYVVDPGFPCRGNPNAPPIWIMLLSGQGRMNNKPVP